MIERVDLVNFKAFERFTLHLRSTSFLVGPNNAGKSTVIAALRAARQMARLAARRYPTETFLDRGATVSGYVFTGDQLGLVEENLRHEFRDVETRLTVRFRGNVRLTAVWPPEGVEPGSFFYLTSRRGGELIEVTPSGREMLTRFVERRELPMPIAELLAAER